DVSARIRVEAGMPQAIDRLLAIYQTAIASPRGAGNPLQAAAAHCCRVALPLKQAYGMVEQLRAMAADRAVANAERDRLVQQAAIERDRLTGLQQTSQREIEAFRALPTIRLRDAVLRAPVVGRVVQAGARGL